MHLSVYRVFNLSRLHAEQPSGPTPSKAKLSCITFAFSTLQSDGGNHPCSTMGAKKRREEICMRHKYNSQKREHASQAISQLQRILPLRMKNFSPPYGQKRLRTRLWSEYHRVLFERQGLFWMWPRPFYTTCALCVLAVRSVFQGGSIHSEVLIQQHPLMHFLHFDCVHHYSELEAKPSRSRCALTADCQR